MARKKKKKNTKEMKLIKAHNNNLKISNMNLKDKYTEFENSKLNESETLLYEINSNPKRFKRYSRGQIVKIRFGVNIGSEFSGDHYAIVVSKKDTMINPILHVIPLTSKKHNYNVKVSASLYDDTQISNLKTLLANEKDKKEKKEIAKCIRYYENRKNTTSYACIKHLKTVSKLSMCKPINEYDYQYLKNIKVGADVLKFIDQEIIKEYTV